MRALLIVALFTLRLALASSYSFEALRLSMLQNSPQVAILRIDKDIAGQDSDIIRAKFYPSFSISTNSEYSKKFNDFLSRYIANESLTSSNGYQNSLTLSLNYEVFKFNATSLSLEANIQKEISYAHKSCGVINELSLNLLELYYEALITKESLSLQTEARALYKQIYDALKKLHSSGEADKLLMANSAVELVSLDDEILNLKQKQSSLLAKISHLSTVDITDSDTLLEFSAPLSNKALPTFSDTPRAKELNALVLNKELSIKAIQREYYPTIYFYAKYDFYGSDMDSYNAALRDSRKNGYRLGISVVYNIFDGFETKAREQRAYLELLRSKEELKEAEYEYQKLIRELKHETYHIDKKLGALMELKDISDDISISNDRLYNSLQIDKITLNKSKIKAINAALKLRLSQIKQDMLNVKRGLILESASCENN